MLIVRNKGSDRHHIWLIREIIYIGHKPNKLIQTLDYCEAFFSTYVKINLNYK